MLMTARNQIFNIKPGDVLALSRPTVISVSE